MNNIKIHKYFIQLRFYWYSLLTKLFGKSHFSKYKLKYGAMLLTLAVTGGCDKINNNSISTERSSSIVSDSVESSPDEKGVMCYDIGSSLPVIPTTEEVDNEICKDVDVYPQYSKSFDVLHRYFLDNLKYPESAIKDGNEGSVVVRFIVFKTGKIGLVKVLRSLSPECDKEAIRLIESMPAKWIPAKQNGKAVNTYFYIPIRFKLDDDKKKNKNKR